MNPDVSRACARLKNALRMAPGDQLDALIEAAEKARSIDELPQWVKAGLKKINDPSMTGK
jgi:HPt (histidine-containing phosphotransfer) domain-containing protein